MLSIVIPVKNPCKGDLEAFIEKNKAYFARYPTIVIDSGGGEPLRPYSTGYFKQDLTLCEARKLGYSFVSTEFTMNLDCDVLIPDHYIEEALLLLETNWKVACVSIFYKDVEHNHATLEYGVSIWRTVTLKDLYDYNPMHARSFCECSWLWLKVLRAGLKIETLPVRAIHIKQRAQKVELLA